jgi:polysaccharide deacetylase family protein (PEP-CTERM system associated)
VADSRQQRSAREVTVANAMTVDVEDYFHVTAFDRIVSRDDWPKYESRVCGNTERLLSCFEEAGVRATFFVLGWVAERHPELVRRIAAGGHEIGSHGFSHRLVYQQTPQAFREDVRRARSAISSEAGVPVLGYRAPTFSVTSRSLWALDVLLEEGHAYDASVFPVHHDRYGIPSSPRHFHQITRVAGTLWECPPSTVRVAGVNLPVAGGGYFRLLPYAWTRWGISQINRREHRPAVFYVHPWEIDSGQPRLGVSGFGAMRHYASLGKTEGRLKRLLGEFEWAPLGEVLGVLPSGAMIPRRENRAGSGLDLFS